MQVAPAAKQSKGLRFPKTTGVATLRHTSDDFTETVRPDQRAGDVDRSTLRGPAPCVGWHADRERHRSRQRVDERSRRPRCRTQPPAAFESRPIWVSLVAVVEPPPWARAGQCESAQSGARPKAL